MTPETKRRIAYSLAAVVIILIWRPLRAAVESDGLFFVLALGAMLLAGLIANRMSR